MKIHAEISFFEIYNEKIHDLLASSPKEKGGKKSTVRANRVLDDNICKITNTYLGMSLVITWLPGSGKNVRKMKFFPDQGKVREFCGWAGKFRKDLESH